MRSICGGIDAARVVLDSDRSILYVDGYCRGDLDLLASGKILEQRPGLRWDDAVRNVLGKTIEDIEADKRKVKKAAGDFTRTDDDEED